ncbi:MAG: HD domain-containing protein [Candidatus Paceibacterota bacterium]
MRKITDIYEEYKNMPLLAMHQIRVAAVAMMICDSLDISVDKENIVKACLIHDIGNIVKFDLNHFPEQNKPEGIDYWQKVKNEFTTKYGSDDHIATLTIVRELGISPRIYEFVDCIDTSVAEKIVEEDDFGKKICAYVDNRVSPYGVVSAEEHSLDSKERYKNHPHAFDEGRRSFFMENIYSIEKQIFSHSNIKPEDINDESVAKYIEKVKDFEI